MATSNKKPQGRSKFDFIVLKNYPKERKFTVVKEMRKGIFSVFGR